MVMSSLGDRERKDECVCIYIYAYTEGARREENVTYRAMMITYHNQGFCSVYSVY